MLRYHLPQKDPEFRRLFSKQCELLLLVLVLLLLLLLFFLLSSSLGHVPTKFRFLQRHYTDLCEMLCVASRAHGPYTPTPRVQVFLHSRMWITHRQSLPCNDNMNHKEELPKRNRRKNFRFFVIECFIFHFQIFSIFIFYIVSYFDTECLGF